MNAKKAKALRKKMREVFGEDVEFKAHEYSRTRGTLKSGPMSGHRIYKQSKRIIAKPVRRSDSPLLPAPKGSE